MATFTLINSYQFTGGGATSMTFTNIPQTYTDLCLFFHLRCSTNSGNFGVPKLRFNGANNDNNFDNRMLIADRNEGVSNSTTTQGLVIRRCPGATGSADFFGSSVVWINDYASTTKEKYFKGIMGTPGLSAPLVSIGISGCVYTLTNAITSITLIGDNAETFAEFSTVYLYGISNA